MPSKNQPIRQQPRPSGGVGIPNASSPPPPSPQYQQQQQGININNNNNYPLRPSTGQSQGSSRRPPSSSAPPPPPPPPPPDEPRYVVYLRLPFPRNGFVDPPPVDWDASKERSLWRHMSRAPRNSELDWNALAEHFHVSVPFLLQQAAWLYERELSQVRAQLRRVGNTAMGGGTASPAPSPNLRDLRTNSTNSVKPNSVPMSPNPSRNASMAPPPMPHRVNSAAPVMSRQTSTATARPTPSQSSLTSAAAVGTLQSPTPDTPVDSAATPKPRFAKPTVLQQQPLSQTTGPPRPIRRVSTESISSSSSASSDASSTEASNRILPKRRNFRKTAEASRSLLDINDAEGEDEDENPAFLPWGEGNGGDEDQENDTSTIVSGGPVRRDRNAASRQQQQQQQQPGGYEINREDNTSGGTIRRGFQVNPPPPLNPIYSDSGASTPASGSSPRRRTNGEGKRVGGHESSPSMGSSFSDLSDASVTQSALEEQYISTVGAGGMASRMSTMTNLRSRYMS